MKPQEVISCEIGHQAEDMFLNCFRKLEYVEVLENKSIQPSKPIAIVKTSVEVDEQEGIDFYLYHRLVGWIQIDICLDPNYERLARKREKERIHHVFVVCLNFGELFRASQGSEIDIKVMCDRIQECFIEAREDPSYITF